MALTASPVTAASQRDLEDCYETSAPNRAIAGCTRAIASGRLARPAAIFFNRGLAWSAKGEFDIAIADYTEAIRREPNFKAAFNSRGYAWNKKGDLDRAISDFSEAIRIDRNYLNPYNNRGIAWKEKGEYDRAIADYNEVIRRDPNHADAYNNRGVAWEKKGDYDHAIADYNEAIRLYPNAAAYFSNRGIAWKEKGEYDHAIADLNEAIRLGPSYANAYNNRGLVWAARGQYDLSIADFTEAIRYGPNDARTYANRGQSWRMKGDLDRALTDQDKAIALEPDGTLVYAHRGDTLRYKGDFPRAIADYEQALRNLPDFIPAFTGLGLTYEKMGDLAKARASFVQAAISQSQFRFADNSKIALETARARLAALDSGVAQPSIPIAPAKATSATSIPTPAVAAPTVPSASVKATVAKQGRRVALVIGNAAYKNVPALVNPKNDADMIAASLRNIGFNSVVLANDATREKLIDSLRAFADEAERSDWAMVYYAGHGLEVGGVNYLVPTDAKLAVDRDIQFEAVPLDQVLAAVESAKKLKLVVLDACRDNPFSPRKTASPATAAAAASTGGAPIASRSIGRGLAEVKASAGTLVVFAAKNGQVALDGEGGNSPFAVAVLQRLPTPGVELNKVFRLVRDDVMEATAGRQEPYTYGSLPGREDFFFVEK